MTELRYVPPVSIRWYVQLTDAAREQVAVLNKKDVKRMEDQLAFVFRASPFMHGHPTSGLRDRRRVLIGDDLSFLMWVSESLRTLTVVEVGAPVDGERDEPLGDFGQNPLAGAESS